VTIGAGFICKDGIVVAADTQESTGYAGYMKGEKFKIDYSEQREWSIAITGAGDSTYVEMCAQKILRSCAISENSPCPSYYGLENIAMEVFQRHLLPLAAYPTSDRPVAHVLIALQQKNGRKEVIEWNGASFVSYYPCRFIGAGEQMGDHLARKFGASSIFMNEALKVSGLVIYILDQVKATVESCGGNTDVIILQDDGRVRRIYTAEVKACEEKYRRMDFGIARSLADKIFAEPPDIDSF
jgi:20S proteasome alpha/beta subunit